MQVNNVLAQKATVKRVLKFTSPTIIMMLFSSLYTMVDGLFVSNILGTTALSAVNIVFPIVCFIGAIGIMFATGGSAITAIYLGEGKPEQARKSFSLFAFTLIAAGILVLIIVLIFAKQIVSLLGANSSNLNFSYEYLSMLAFFAPMAMLQMFFQSYFVTAGKPRLGLISIILGGIMNVILDYLFMSVLGMGIKGAALATGIGYCIPAIFGLLYFSLNRKGTLYFVKTRAKFALIGNACANGSSEMVTNLSLAIVTLLFNLIMTKRLGEDGVASITIVLYAQYLFNAIFLGYAIGIAPMISYSYGSANTDQLKRLFKISMGFVIIGALVAFGLELALAKTLTGIFSKPGTAVYDIALNGFYLFSPAFLFLGINIFSSAMFTALANGKVSALLSLLRSLVFIVALLLTLPLLFGTTGVWIAVPIAEFLGFTCALICFIKYKKKYNYA